MAALFCVSGNCLAESPGAESSQRNAADYYRQAAAAIEQLPDIDRAFVESTAVLQLLALYAPPSSWSDKEVVSFSGAVPSDEGARETLARLEPALTLFRQGAETPACDWGFDFASGNLSTPIPHLGLVTDLVPSVLFRARYLWAAGKRQEAVDDLEALKRFAAQVGAEGDGGLISLVVQFNIERVVVCTISRWLVDAESARMLGGVAQEPDRPQVNLAKKALLLETETVHPLAKRLIETSGLTAEERRARYEADLFSDSMTVGELVQRYSEKALLAQIEQSDDHYRHVGRLLDLPARKFQPQFDRYMREVRRTRNFFSETGLVQCPGIERVYYDVKELHARWSMLQAAIDIYQAGPRAVRDHEDPFGRGPFRYDRRGDGFVLTSDLVVNGAAVDLQFDLAPGGPQS